MADQLNSLLFKADAALDEVKGTEAILALTEFAEIAFTIPPFTPDELPEKWRGMLALWLQGEPMSAIVALGGEDAAEFIEDDIIYRLVWAAEAVRVRSQAHVDDYSSLWTGRAAEASEVGTMQRPATILLQAGLGSRAAALAALNDQPGDFVDYDGMRRWLQSETVVEASRSASWPTSDTAESWRQFVLGISSDPTEEWRCQRTIRRVVWNSKEFRPADGTVIRLVNSNVLRTEVDCADHTRLGHLQSPLPSLPGVAYGVVQSAEHIDVRYFGPGVLS